MTKVRHKNVGYAQRAPLFFTFFQFFKKGSIYVVFFTHPGQLFGLWACKNGDFACSRPELPPFNHCGTSKGRKSTGKVEKVTHFWKKWPRFGKKWHGSGKVGGKLEKLEKLVGKVRKVTDSWKKWPDLGKSDALSGKADWFIAKREKVTGKVKKWPLGTIYKSWESLASGLYFYKSSPQK